MCDCYEHPCEMCGCEISIHIADFCTDRENVHPYCTRCTRKLVRAGIPEGKKVFEDTVIMSGKYGPVPGARKGQKVIILCDDPKAYGIHLN